MHKRGIGISHETVRYWWDRFGPMVAAEVRGKCVEAMRAHRQWQWHLDEAYEKINGVTHYLWRAVDHKGEVLESIVPKTIDRKAVLKFLKKAMKRHGRPETEVRISEFLGPQPLSNGATSPRPQHLKETRVAAFAEARPSRRLIERCARETATGFAFV